MYQGHPDQHFGHITYSQHGEDLMIANLFKLLGIDKPSYLDLGAHHPFHISNTALLYSRGSRGINIEANPNLIGEFEKHRPEDKNLCVGVLPVITQPTAKLLMYDPQSGRNTMSYAEVKAYGREVREQIDVPVFTLTEIVTEHCNGIYPHFLSVDLEGFDYDVLRGTNFTHSAPVIVCVETRLEQIPDMVKMMKSQGFSLEVRMGENLVFTHLEYHSGKLI